MKKMSKLFAVLLAMLMLCGMLAGCGKQQTEQESQSGQTEQNALSAAISEAAQYKAALELLGIETEVNES